MSSEFATIITDASFVQASRSGTWAGTVISDYGRQEFSGKLKGEILSSNYAELAGVANTLFCALRDPRPSASILRDPRALRPGMGWLIQLDNLHVLRLLTHHFGDMKRPFCPPHTERQENEVMERIRAMHVEAAPSFVRARHIKGHVYAEDRDARQHVQHRMDRLAAQARRS